MDKPIIHNILRSPFFWTGILLFAFLIAFSYHKEREVEKTAETKVRLMAKEVSINNILILKDIFLQYAEKLEYIKHSIDLSPQNEENIIAYIAEKDELFRNTQIVSFQNDLSPFKIEPFLNDSLPYIQITVPLEQKGKAVSLKIGLRELHEKIAENKSFSYAYLTVSFDNKYIYHPDESKIGKPIHPTDHAELTNAQGNNVIDIDSEYLNIPVYRYLEQPEIGGKTWTFTANVPGISIRELVSNTRNAFMYFSLLALFAFAFIFFLGITHWRRELVNRQQLQAEKVKLELKNEQQKQLVLAKELEELKSGLNPHFLFNSLSSLKILVDKQPQEAKRFAVALSNLYRYLLKQEKLDLISLNEELNFTKDYIYLQQIRFSNKISVETRIDDKFLEMQLPPMSLQLLIENCIKHTKMSVKNPLKITIDAQDNCIVVKNNYNPPESVHPSGRGLSNLKARYSYLTDKFCAFYVEENPFIAKIPLL